jgi:hypothetical protein
MVRGEANHKVCANLEVPSFCGLNPWEGEGGEAWFVGGI